MKGTENIMDFYEHIEKCWNCRHSNKLRIPRGTAIFTYLQTAKCRGCGCGLNGKDGSYGY